MSSIKRERKLERKQESKGMRKPRGPADGSKKYSIAKIKARIAEYPDAPFIALNGTLRCTACECIVAMLRKSSVDQHLITAKHKQNTEKLERRKLRDEGVITSLREFFQNNPSVVGASVPLEDQAYRFQVTSTLLAAGIPLLKADALRNLLERSGHAMTTSPHLRVLVPLVEKREIAQTRADIEGQHIFVTFDGTPRVGEAINIVCRFCSESFEIEMRLLAFVTAAASCDASALVQLINPILMQRMQIKPEMVVGFGRDSVACNGRAMVTLSVLYGSSEDMLCVSHTLTHVGDRFEFEVLEQFMTPWYTLVCNNQSAKSLWKEMIGEPVKGFSPVRWYCRAEIMMQIGMHFDKLLHFLQQLEEREIGDVTTTKMLNIYRSSTAELRLAFAAMIDMRPLVVTTYTLEGDRLEILLAYGMLQELLSLGRRLGEPGTLRNVDCVLRQDMKIKPGVKIVKLWDGVPFEGKVIETATAESTLYPGQERKVYKVHYSADDTAEDLEDEEIRKLLVITELEVSARWPALRTHPCTCILCVALQLTSPDHYACSISPQPRKKVIASLTPGFEYLEKRLTDQCARPYHCAHMLAVLNAVRAFDPAWAALHNLSADGVRSLSVVRCISEELIEGMLTELDGYTTAARDFETDRADVDAFTTSVLKFWRTHRSRLPTWAKAARIIFALSPNSASCERVFSLLASMYTPEQKGTLKDALQASLMLRYNKREVG